MDTRGALTRDGQQESALRSEALQERGGRDARLPADISEGEARGAEPLDHAHSGGKDVGVRLQAGARRHELRDYKRTAVYKQPLTINEQPFINRHQSSGEAVMASSRKNLSKGIPETKSDLNPLKGRVALVAGATRGVGRGIAVALGEAGATVYCTGRSS